MGLFIYFAYVLAYQIFVYYFRDGVGEIYYWKSTFNIVDWSRFKKADILFFWQNLDVDFREKSKLIKVK